MNRILIMSDSHGLTSELQTIKSRHEVDHYIHVGDSELETNSPFIEGYQSVSGNCDWNATFPNNIYIDEGGIRIFVTHGHLYGVKSSLLKLQYAATENDAQIICFGHSHILYCEKIDNRIYINPGSLRLPRNYPKPTYVIVSWENKEAIHVTYYHVDGEEVPALSKTFSI